MNNLKDLTNKRFGRLIVIKRGKTPENITRPNTIYWLCRCDCGNEKIISGNCLGRNTSSCGCYQKERVSESNLKDLTGQKFGRLIVIKRVENHIKQPSGQIKTKWLCECECGNKTEVTSSELKTGKTQSCGCYHKEKISKPLGESTKERVYRDYKRHAKNKNLLFELSKDEFFELTKQNCFYCGDIPSNTSKSEYDNGDYIYNGVDRKNSLEGYTTDNVVPCCWICNQAKHNYSQKEFYEWIKKVYKYNDFK